MFDNKKESNRGFTIIEVLIVLAIAGLIMLVVFLAVPALQRNQRNESFRAEARNIGAAYTEISANKGGVVLAAADGASVLTASNAKNVTTLNIAVPPAVAADISFDATLPTPANRVSFTTIVIRTGSRCAAATSGVQTLGTTRQAALYYVVETAGGGNQLQCLEISA